jgi:predicted small lipoprotein YifL
MSARLVPHVTLLALALALALGACGRPGPRPTPGANPGAPAPAAPAGGAAESGAQRQLQEALLRADDQFNRGENDLACGQVQRARTLLNRRQATASAAQRQQLLRFEQACSTL